MAAKRTASNELTHDNWDDDYEPEEAGTFKKASADVIKNRVIKTARRRHPISANNDSAKNVFSGFDGFKKATTETKNSSPFAFTSLVPTKTDSNTFGLFKNITSSTNVSTTPSITGAATSPFKIPEIPTNPTNTKDKTDSNENSSYYGKLKGLNESVLDWIKSHVEKNPFIILSPIFEDYDKYLKEIEKENESTETGNSQFLSSSAKSLAHSASIFSNLSNKSSDSNFFSSESMEKTQGKTTSETSISGTSTPSFSFGSKNSNTSQQTGFSFGSGKPFAFANVSRPDSETTAATTDSQQQQEDEDEPPKVEFTPVVEDGSVFQKRCKVFVKKDGQYSDRGVGQLFLKPVEGSEKIQLIVRADTSLGNLLLNFILNSSVPLQRMGKNNVMLVSIPTPECKPPPVPILLRVKTSEEADDLLKVLQKHSK